MKTWIGILALAGALGAAAFVLRPWSTRDAHAETVSADDDRIAAATAGHSADAPLPTPSGAAPDVHKAQVASADVADTPSARVTEDEAALLEMYDEMSAVLERHADDCAATAAGVRTAITEREAEVRRVVALASQRGAHEARAAEARVTAAAGGQTDRFRALLAKSLQTCAAELMPELQRLSTLGGEDKE